MAIVNMLRFDRYRAAIACDEEYWLLRRRKSFLADSLHPVLPPEVAEATGLELVYAGTGSPSFHLEVVQRARRAFVQAFRAGAFPFETVDQMAAEVLKCHQATIRRRVDGRLRFLYGFGVDDLNRGYFEDGGKRFDIKQEQVRSAALKIVQYQDKSPPLQETFENFAVILGYDPREGIRAFHVNGEKMVLAFVSGGWESIGPGKYAAALSLARFFNNRTVAERRGDLDPCDGLIELISATQLAAEHYHEAGGHISLALVDGRGQGREQRYREVLDDEARLAGEIVLAYRWRHLGRNDTRNLLGQLVLNRAGFDAIEPRLFERALQPERLRLVLRGYKRDPHEIPVPRPEAPARPGRPEAEAAR